MALVKTRGPLDALHVFFFGGGAVGKLRNPEIAESGFRFEGREVRGVCPIDGTGDVVGVDGMEDMDWTDNASRE